MRHRGKDETDVKKIRLYKDFYSLLNTKIH